jgi:hypothetical protein
VSGEQRHRQVVAAVLATDPTLSVAQVEAAIAAVTGHPAALRSLAVALTADPAALTTAAPPVVGRLVEALRANGVTSLQEPSCAVCARVGQPLTRSSTGGVCARCADRPQRQCGRCGRIRRIARRAQGDQPDICDGCFQLPEATCSGCGRRRPCSFASTNTPVCTGCAAAQRPLRPLRPGQATRGELGRRSGLRPLLHRPLLHRRAAPSRHLRQLPDPAATSQPART